MGLIACTIRNISLVTVTNGNKYKGGIDFEGDELSSVQTFITEEPNKREYYCDNCNTIFDGSETFDEVKAHLGTFPVD
jgi:hypothetical protein